ncbi:EexN family lipoprotein [Citrobacter freundii]|uniref:EexN family lipoprotein n=1 Tax=Citrobacter freundii TaxID=546 RepID=UPI001E3EE5D3|nr:EexN family lipoprotein [Citrobacter freundii]
MKKIALILLSSTLAACSPSGKPDKANLPTVDELALNPERLKELRKQCKLDRPMLGDQLCNRVAEATWTCLGFVPVFLRALFVIKETIYVIKA